MKQCEKIKDLFGSYLYNTITPTERADVEKHLRTCQECAEDLKTRRMALGKIGKYISDSENAEIDQERFMWNVYKKIATDSIRQKRRQVVVRKFVYQPALATLAVALIISFVSIVSVRHGSNDVPQTIVNTPSIQTSNETIKEIKQPVKVKPNIVENPKSENIVVAKKASEKPKSLLVQPKPDVLVSKAELSNSRDLLMEADFTYYSLGDSRRALSKYDTIINRYPDTDAASEARKRVNSIIASEYNVKDENTGNIELIKTGI
jgi:hypothetical protein